MKTCDIFCRVIDNYGDIGVCWRLAKQLVREYDLEVRLWVDNLQALRKIAPAATLANKQHVYGVELRHWQNRFANPGNAADLVIEAFACNLPPVYLQRLAERHRQGRAAVWLNLEYLSAEGWVDDHHLLPSIQPQSGTSKVFYFPGFSEGSGGLLRERDLLAARDAFQSHGASSQWLSELGVERPKEALLLSLFCYPNAPLQDWLEIWQQSATPLHCLIPEGKVSTALAQILGRELRIGDVHQHGALSLQILPFVDQDSYDRLLWACDLNFVRGEDSFVRAQWAGRPFVWQAYPQEQKVHLQKLEAFLSLYLEAGDRELTRTLGQFFRAWNGAEADLPAPAKLLSTLNDWRHHSRRWCDDLAHQQDLCSRLSQFAEKLSKARTL